MWDTKDGVCYYIWWSVSIFKRINALYHLILWLSLTTTMLITLLHLFDNRSMKIFGKNKRTTFLSQRSSSLIGLLVPLITPNQMASPNKKTLECFQMRKDTKRHLQIAKHSQIEGKRKREKKRDREKCCSTKPNSCWNWNVQKMCYTMEFKSLVANVPQIAYQIL